MTKYIVQARSEEVTDEQTMDEYRDTTYIGTYQADSAEEAVKKAVNDGHEWRMMWATPVTHMHQFDIDIRSDGSVVLQKEETDLELETGHVSGIAT